MLRDRAGIASYGQNRFWRVQDGRGDAGSARQEPKHVFRLGWPVW